MTMDNRLEVLVVGATGSIGRHVVEEALRAGHRVRALVRNGAGARLPGEADICVGDLTRPETLSDAVADITGVVFVHGTYGSNAAAEAVDYGGVRNVLEALRGRPVTVALMTAIGVTDRKGAHDWKRRAERLVRASGGPYTIVRPGWFDYNTPDQRHLAFLQGDTRQSGSPRDGVIARAQVAKVLVAALTSSAAHGKTLELVAVAGEAQVKLDDMFRNLDIDAEAGLDGAHDAKNMPLDREPGEVLSDLDRTRRSRRYP
ncbi:NAD-dependent dehydratase [Azorhizobium oxalatiphilum]|uniref:NAD-dependent dehydratase n=1 Tax=Azorhizobium oxalatiphilum TaxID=980631 RepID=A0A917FCL6_9HYPH|nr:SDR family oxidoreductase [Azorhizobium oxalatiphilum]GGF62440.1 NAD-dependent dehydratase [Azorhizobium oxalatiphilum]